MYLDIFLAFLTKENIAQPSGEAVLVAANEAAFPRPRLLTLAVKCSRSTRAGAARAVASRPGSHVGISLLGAECCPIKGRGLTE